MVSKKPGNRCIVHFFLSLSSIFEVGDTRDPNMQYVPWQNMKQSLFFVFEKRLENSNRGFWCEVHYAKCVKLTFQVQQVGVTPHAYVSV